MQTIGEMRHAAIMEQSLRKIGAAIDAQSQHILALTSAVQTLADAVKNCIPHGNATSSDAPQGVAQSGADSADGDALPSDPQTPADWGRLFDAFGYRIKGADGLAAHIGWGVSEAGMEALYALRNSKCDHDGRIFALLEYINYHTSAKDFVFNPRGDF